jgi:hypothetical protein
VNARGGLPRGIARLIASERTPAVLRRVLVGVDGVPAARFAVITEWSYGKTAVV